MEKMKDLPEFKREALVLCFFFAMTDLTGKICSWVWLLYNSYGEDCFFEISLYIILECTKKSNPVITSVFSLFLNKKKKV